MGDHVDLDRLAALEKAATAGPWVDAGNKLGAAGHGIAEVDFDDDADRVLAVEARNALPALLRELRSARAAASAASAYLQATDAAAERPATDAGLMGVLAKRDALRAALAARESQGGGGG
jgi:hypothetical protein